MVLAALFFVGEFQFTGLLLDGLVESGAFSGLDV